MLLQFYFITSVSKIPLLHNTSVAASKIKIAEVSKESFLRSKFFIRQRKKRVGCSVISYLQMHKAITLENEHFVKFIAGVFSFRLIPAGSA